MRLFKINAKVQKVPLADLASSRPSRATRKALVKAMADAKNEQEVTRTKAARLRTLTAR